LPAQPPLLGPYGGRVPVVGYALFDPRYELRGVTVEHLPDARPKLMPKIHARVTANRRTQSFERLRRGSRSVGTVNSGYGDRSQQPKKIRRVELLSVVFPELLRVIIRREAA